MKPTGSKFKQSQEKEKAHVHFRLCHFCLFLNESVAEVGQCRKCRRHLTFGALLNDVTAEELAEAWINEGFEGSEEEAEDLAEEELENLAKREKQVDSDELSSIALRRQHLPALQGLSVVW